MSEQLELFKCLLNKDFYNDFKHKVTKELFPEELFDLYDALEFAHSATPGSLITADLWAVFKMLNPTLTTARKTAIYNIINAIKAADSLNIDIAKQTVNRALVEDKANKIARVSLEIASGKHEDWGLLRSLLEADVVKQDIDLVTTNLQNLSADIVATYKWRFNLGELDKAIGPIGPEVFIVLAGNVNTGKSLAAISFVFAPGGFLDQGAKVLYIGNEESLKRTMMRGATCWMGMTKAEIINDPKAVQEHFDKITKHCYMIDDVAMNFNKLNYVVDKLQPDIVVLDMLDNIPVTGTFARGDEKLGKIYREARELAKRHKCAVFGLSQTSAESMGKLYVDFDKLAGSKVDKAASADLVLIIGKLSSDLNADSNDNFRVINVAKSKLEGNGAKVNCQIQPQISRLVA